MKHSIGKAFESTPFSPLYYVYFWLSWAVIIDQGLFNSRHRLGAQFMKVKHSLGVPVLFRPKWFVYPWSVITYLSARVYITEVSAALQKWRYYS